MDIRDVIESKCMGISCCLVWYFNPPCCIPWCAGNCCLPYDEYLQSTDGKVLRQACHEGNYDTVKLMSDKWKDVSARSCCLVNPLSEGSVGERLNSVHISALKGHLEILKLLLDTNRIDVDQYTYYDYPFGFFSKFKHRTAVHIALATGHVECLKLLIDHGGANLKKPAYEAHTTCFTMIIAPSRVQLQPTEISSIDMLSKKFIEYMATVEYDSSLSSSPSSSPSSSSSSSTTATSSGNSPSFTLTESKSPIIISTNCCDHKDDIIKTHHPIRDYDACVSLLESHGFIFNSHIEYALDTAYRYSNYVIFELFSKRDTTNLVNNKHYLHRAIKEKRKLEMIHTLLRSGVDVNGLDGVGKVAAFYAC